MSHLTRCSLKKKLTRNVMSKELRPLREISDKKKNVPNDKVVPTWYSRVWTKRGLGYGLPNGLPVVDFLELVSALL